MVFKKGQQAWNKGLTKSTDERVRKYSGNISKSMKGKAKVNSGSFKKGRKSVAWNKGMKGIKTNKKGGKPWNDGLTKKDPRVKRYGENCSKTKKGKPNPKMMGEKNPMWKGGITEINKRIKNSLEYKLWRRAVFKRDNYACIWCGSKNKIQADHIKPFADYPELRFAIDNGRALCRSCHLRTSNYGGKNK